MTVTLKVNSRNDLHLPAEIIRRMNLGNEKMVKAQLQGNVLFLVPVDVEPRYSHEELEGLDKLHADEKKKSWIRLKSEKDIDRLVR